jgi:hypothetical protein
MTHNPNGAFIWLHTLPPLNRGITVPIRMRGITIFRGTQCIFLKIHFFFELYIFFLNILSL